MSVSEWKAREKEQRRNDIIVAAEKLFFSKGFDKVSMDDIAREIRLNKATLYRYFMSKEALFFTVVLRGTRIQHELFRALKSGGTGLERLIAYNNVSSDFDINYPDYHRLICFYTSGRFDLERLAKSDDVACMASQDYREPARISDEVGGEKAESVGRLLKSGDMAYAPTNEYRRWVKLADTTESEVVREISRLRLEMFEVLRHILESGQRDGSLRADLSPGELVIFIGIISSGLASLNPDIKSLLGNQKIAEDQFARNLQTFLYKVLAKAPETRNGDR